MKSLISALLGVVIVSVPSFARTQDIVFKDLALSSTSSGSFKTLYAEDICVEYAHLALISKKYAQLYYSKTAQSATQAYISFENENSNETCSRIVVTSASTACSTSKLQLYINNVAYGNPVTLAQVDTDYQFDIPEEYRASGNIYKLVATVADAKLYKVSLDLNTPSVDLKNANLSFADEIVYTHLNDNAFVAPKVHSDSSAPVVYSSSNPDVATVDASTGQVVAVAPGTTVITAECEANEEYTSGNATYTLVVASSVNSFNQLTDGQVCYLASPLIATYQHGEDTYVSDLSRENAMLIRSSSFPLYSSGDIIPGEWYATLNTGSHVPYLTPVTMPGSSEGWEMYVPVVCSALTDDMVNKVIMLENVTVKSDNGADMAVSENGTFPIENRFGVSPNSDGSYDLVAAVGKNDAGLCVYPIEYRVAQNTSVTTIDTPTSEPVFYNLQGIKSNSTGVVIRVDAAHKATKVIRK